MSTPFNKPMGSDPLQRMQSEDTRATELRHTALILANQLFDQGDLSAYLDVLVRLDFLNFYNLLLVLHQYPDATHLGSFSSWKQYMKQQNPDIKWVIKKDQQKKAIELIAPFTHLQADGSSSLSWRSLRQLDVSQINIEHYSPPKRAYLSGPEHVHLLNRCLRSVLSDEYDTVIQADIVRLDHPSGYFEDNTIHCSPTISPENLVMLLTQHLFMLAHPERTIGEEHTHLFLLMAQHCLYRIWGMQDRRMLFLSLDPKQIQCITPDLRPVFLDLLQRQVRQADERIYSKYQGFLFE